MAAEIARTDRRFRRVAVAVASVGALLLLLVPWYRNRGYLIDFCDYGLIMAAVGRLGAGELPYVDFLTPIQSLPFLLGRLTEAIAGPTYLGLTTSGAVSIGVSFLIMTAILRRHLGSGLALMVSSAVVSASATQHTIVWYNALGTLWLAVVVWLTAPPAIVARGSLARFGGVAAALWLGGMTKLTYQAAAMAFAVAFALRAGWTRELRWRSVGLLLGGYLMFGVVAPIATELCYTEASLDEWLYNVVLLPGRFRTGMLRHIATPDFYLHTPHDYYHPLYLAFAGLWGLVLVIAVTGLLGRAVVRDRSERARQMVCLVVLCSGAWICGGVLLATNMDIAYVSAAAWLVFAAALMIAFPNVGDRTRRRVRIILGAAAVSLAVPAWISAWQGARALWGHEPLVRSTMVRTEDLPRQFRYLDGLKITPSMHESFRLFAQQQTLFNDRHVPPSAYFFANGMDWMVRVIPEARHRGLPLWLAGGTTLGEGDAWAIGERLSSRGEFRVIITHDAWNYWYPGVLKTLTAQFKARRLGERLYCYVRADRIDPLEFSRNTQSNLYSRDMHVQGVTPEVRLGANRLFFLGGSDPHRIDFDGPLFRLTGEMYGELSPFAGKDAVVEATMNVYARNGSTLTDLLWQEKMVVRSDHPQTLSTFSISPGGRPVSLVLQVPAGREANFGWRRLDTQHSGPLQAAPPHQVTERLPLHPMNEDELTALFGPHHDRVAEAVAYGQVSRNVHEGVAEVMSGVPGEIWFRLDQPVGTVSGDYGFDAGSSDGNWSGMSKVAVVYYKSGRFEVRHDFELRPGPETAGRKSHHFSVALPESSGWIGLVLTTQADNMTPTGHVWWRNLELH